MDILYTVKHIINNDYFIFTGAIDEAIAFSIPDFVPGVSYALTVRGIDVEEQTDTEVVEFEIAPLPGMLMFNVLTIYSNRITIYPQCRDQSL